MVIRIVDLLYMPYGARSAHLDLQNRRHLVRPGAGTVILLPDGLTTAEVYDATDDRWKSCNSKAIEVSVVLNGPGARLDVRALMDLLAGKTAEGGWRRGSRCALTFSLAADAEFPLLAAWPHTCGSQPGEQCVVRYGDHGRILCTTDPATQKIVRFDRSVAA